MDDPFETALAVLGGIMALGLVGLLILYMIPYLLIIFTIGAVLASGLFLIYFALTFFATGIDLFERFANWIHSQLSSDND